MFSAPGVLDSGSSGIDGSKRQDAGLIGFVDLAVAPIEFQAVAIRRDVAAGDHDRGDTEAHRFERKRRRRQRAAVGDRNALGGRARGHGGSDARTAVAEVAADQQTVPCPEVAEECPRVARNESVGELGDEPAQAAGAEAWRFTHQVRPKSSWMRTMSSSPR